MRDRPFPPRGYRREGRGMVPPDRPRVGARRIADVGLRNLAPGARARVHWPASFADPTVAALVVLFAGPDDPVDDLVDGLIARLGAVVLTVSAAHAVEGHAAVAWAADHAAELGVDAARIAVVGDRSGAAGGPGGARGPPRRGGGRAGRRAHGRGRLAPAAARGVDLAARRPGRRARRPRPSAGRARPADPERPMTAALARPRAADPVVERAVAGDD